MLSFLLTCVTSKYFNDDIVLLTDIYCSLPTKLSDNFVSAKYVFFISLFSFSFGDLCEFLFPNKGVKKNIMAT